MLATEMMPLHAIQRLLPHSMLLTTYHSMKHVFLRFHTCRMLKTREHKNRIVLPKGIRISDLRIIQLESCASFTHKLSDVLTYCTETTTCHEIRNMAGIFCQK